MLIKIGLFSCCAFCIASSPQGYQLTGLWACCRKYGLKELVSWLVCLLSPFAVGIAVANNVIKLTEINRFASFISQIFIFYRVSTKMVYAATVFIYYLMYFIT